MTDKAEIKVDHRRTQRLYMKRNHPRLNQTSRFLLQSWRGNCDVQILVYNSSPSKPDIAEIAKITDYIVSYQCKGNHSWKEEREQLRQLIMASEDIGFGKQDIVRVAKQIMNKTSSKRVISKQEAMVLLADLPLTASTEAVDMVTINNSAKLRTTGEKKKDNRFVSRYTERPAECEPLSPYDYFLYQNNDGKKAKKGQKYIIPNFVGFSGTPRFPVTEGYARHTIVVYTPWRKYPTNRNWLAEFELFINSGKCPPSCRMSYDRVMLRHYHNLTYYEATSTKVNRAGNKIPEDAAELLSLVGLPPKEILDTDTSLIKSLHRGVQYKWDKTPQVSRSHNGQDAYLNLSLGFACN